MFYLFIIAKMVNELSQDAAAVPVGQQTVAQMTSLGELTQSDLTSLVGGLQPEPEEDNQMGDTDDIFKQLGESAFELDHFFSDFNATEIKVRRQRHP